MCGLIGHRLFHIHLNVVCMINMSGSDISRSYVIGEKMCHQHREASRSHLAITEPNIVQPTQKTGVCYYVSNSMDAMAR